MEQTQVTKVKLEDVNFMLEKQKETICRLIKDCYLQEMQMIKDENIDDANFYRGQASAYEYTIKSLSVFQSRMENLLK